MAGCLTDWTQGQLCMYCAYFTVCIWLVIVSRWRYWKLITVVRSVSEDPRFSWWRVRRIRFTGMGIDISNERIAYLFRVELIRQLWKTLAFNYQIGSHCHIREEGILQRVSLFIRLLWQFSERFKEIVTSFQSVSIRQYWNWTTVFRKKVLHS